MSTGESVGSGSLARRLEETSPAAAGTLEHCTAATPELTECGVLSNAELLGAVLGIALSEAEGLLRELGGLRRMRAASLSELVSLGLGPAVGRRLQASIELGRRERVAEAEPLTVGRPSDLGPALAAAMGDLEVEEVRLVLLNTKQQVLGWPIVAIGGLDSATLRFADIFRHAIRNNAASFALAHNHPSRDPAPSTVDLRFTTELVQLGNQLGVAVLDHIIVGGDGWCSLRMLGLGGFRPSR